MIIFRKRTRDRLILTLTAISLLSSLPTFAATASKNKVNKKSISYIEVSIDSNITEGMEYGSESIEIKTETNHVDVDRYYISDYNLKDTPKEKTKRPDYNNDDDDNDDNDNEKSYDYGSEGAERPTGTWTDTPPTLAVVFKTTDSEKYKFSIHNSSGFKIMGTAAAKYKSVSGSSDKVTLLVNLETVKSGTYKLTGTYVTEDGETVVFPYSDENTYFTVRLYKGKKIYSVSQTDVGEDQFDLTSIVYDAGTYTVQVRAYDKSTHQQTAWITLPEQIKYSSSDVRLSQKELGIRLIKQNPDGTSTELKSTEKAPTGGNIPLHPTDEGTFEEVTKGVWRWKEPDGNYALNKWHRYDGQWYYFDLSGYMVKGWRKINNKWYYFDDNIGYAKSGWRKINNKWYYFDTNDQALLTSTTTPDGYVVDANGEWIEAPQITSMNSPADGIK